MSSECIVGSVGWGLLVNVDIPRIDSLAYAGKTVALDDIVLFLLLARCRPEEHPPNGHICNYTSVHRA